MNYSMGSGILRYIRASKTFSKFRALRSSVRFEVQCASKFRAVTVCSICFLKVVGRKIQHPPGRGGRNSHYATAHWFCQTYLSYCVCSLVYEHMIFAISFDFSIFLHNLNLLVIHDQIQYVLKFRQI